MRKWNGFTTATRASSGVRFVTGIVQNISERLFKWSSKVVEKNKEEELISVIKPNTTRKQKKWKISGEDLYALNNDDTMKPKNLEILAKLTRDEIKKKQRIIVPTITVNNLAYPSVCILVEFIIIIIILLLLESFIFVFVHIHTLCM